MCTEYNFCMRASISLFLTLYPHRTTLEDPNFYYKAILNELESLDSSWGDLADQVATFMKSVLNSISNCTCYSTGNVDRNQVM